MAAGSHCYTSRRDREDPEALAGRRVRGQAPGWWATLLRRRRKEVSQGERLGLGLMGESAGGYIQGVTWTDPLTARGVILVNSRRYGADISPSLNYPEKF